MDILWESVGSSLLNVCQDSEHQSKSVESINLVIQSSLSHIPSTVWGKYFTLVKISHCHVPPFEVYNVVLKKVCKREETRGVKLMAIVRSAGVLPRQRWTERVPLFYGVVNSFDSIPTLNLSWNDFRFGISHCTLTY